MSVGGGEFKSVGSEETRKDVGRVADNGILFVEKLISHAGDIKGIEHAKKKMVNLRCECV